MLLCNETVTLVRHDRTRTGDSFACTAIVGVSWYAKATVKPPSQMGANGVELANTFKVRIPEANLPEGAALRTGDYLVRGVVGSVERLADLKDREYFKIMTVGDNRRGRLRHWAVSGA